MKIVYLKCKSSYFRNSLHSDSLFGSILWAISVIYGQDTVKSILESYKDNDPVMKLSSCFPFCEDKNNKIQKFFPKPLIPFSLSLDDDKDKASKIKQFKKLKYFEYEQWKKLMQGKISFTDIFNNSAEWDKWKTASPKSTYILQNSLDRLTNSTSTEDGGGALYFSDNYYIPEGGLFFLAKGKDLKHLDGALAFLSHKGFGGDANIGKGSFDIWMEELESFTEVQNPQSFINLSLYSPTTDEIDLYNNNPDKVFYDLMYRKGIIGGSYLNLRKPWKKPVLAFTEGSIFPVVDKKTIGQNLKVSDPSNGLDFDVYHYGISFDVGININN